MLEVIESIGARVAYRVKRRLRPGTVNKWLTDPKRLDIVAAASSSARTMGQKIVDKAVSNDQGVLDGAANLP
jgi:hypothetical protein